MIIKGRRRILWFIYSKFHLKNLDYHLILIKHLLIQISDFPIFIQLLINMMVRFLLVCTDFTDVWYKMNICVISDSLAFSWFTGSYTKFSIP